MSEYISMNTAIFSLGHSSLIGIAPRPFKPDWYSEAHYSATIHECSPIQSPPCGGRGGKKVENFERA